MQSLFFLITTMFQRGINKKNTFNKHFARKYIRAYTISSPTYFLKVHCDKTNTNEKNGYGILNQSGTLEGRPFLKMISTCSLMEMSWE